MKFKLVFIQITLIAFALSLGCAREHNVRLDNLMVEYTITPLGIDVETPRFSWQMLAANGRGYSQSSYHVKVQNPEGEEIWNSGKINNDESVGIEYKGSPLEPSTRYKWTVTVWDQDGEPITASSWFETGLMNPDITTWEGTRWIGGGDEDLVLFAPYLLIFNLEYTVAIHEGSSKASIVYGANDSRLMDKNKNIYGIENGKDESYIKVELDISDLDGTEDGKARLNIYRSGYKDTDDPGEPLQSWDIFTSVINEDNKHNEHKITLSSAFGTITISIDDEKEFTDNGEQRGDFGFPGRRERNTTLNINPAGRGGDYLPFGFLCDIGFSVDPGQIASFSDVTVYNRRYPGNILFKEDLNDKNYAGIYSGAVSDPESGLSVATGKYVVAGGSEGIFIVEDPSRNSAPLLRTEFETAGKKINKARLYITARGIYEVFINGKRVGDDYYNPGLTQYNITHMYQTYDITGMLEKGHNAIGAMLGEGWWSGLLSFGDEWNYFGDRQSLLAKIVIWYSDGSEDIIATNDNDWKYFSSGPRVYGSMDMGEFYDATREEAIEGWTEAGFDDSDWKNTVIVPLEGTAFLDEKTERGAVVPALQFDKMALLGQIGNNAGIFKTINAISVKEVRDGVFVYNLGQNIVGVPRLTIKKGEKGKKVTLRYAEVLYPDMKEYEGNEGMIMTENYRAALSQDVYIMKDGRQVYQPGFTSHGFQYIEITGIDGALPLEDVQGVAISSIRELSADYETSNPKVNRLWSNLVWSNIDNFLTIPTDCPQRNERMGWSGDINVFSRTATYVSNVDQFLTRHMYAMRDVQRPSGKFTDVAPIGGGFGGVLWGSAGIVVPWETYLQYNDAGILKQHYPAMKAYMKYLETTIDNQTGLSSDGRLGDWLGPQDNQLGSAFLVTAYHALDLRIMSEIAEIIGEEEDSARFMVQYQERKKYFNEIFVSADKKALGLVSGRRDFRQPPSPPEFKVADVQTAYAVGLGMDLFNDSNKPFMVENLAAAVARKNIDDEGILRPEYSLMTGFIGTAWISRALSDIGRSDLAYHLLQNEQYPSWLYPVNNGATSIWERLNGYTIENGFGGNNSMNSFNHYSFGAVGQWMMAYSLGIQRDEPGFKKFILQPEPDPTGQMTRAGGYYDSMYGRIKSEWKTENDKMYYKATVPANTSATLYLPASSADDITEGGKPADQSAGITLIRFEKNKAIYRLLSGTYEFVSDI